MIRYMDPGRVERFAIEIAQHLGEGWERQKVYQDHGIMAPVLVNGDERIALVHSTYGARHAERITFMGLSLDVDLENPKCLHRLRGPMTTAALARPAKTVAAQIDRNLRPAYRRLLDAERSRTAEREAAQAARRAEGERLAALLPGGAQYSNRDRELINFVGPDRKAASMTIISTVQDDFHYSLEFAQDKTFLDDLLDLIRKHCS